MRGITGRLYQQFALTIAVSVLISAFNALTLSPALARCCCEPRRRVEGPARRGSGAASTAASRAPPTATSRINRTLVRKLAIPLVLLVGVDGDLGGCSAAQLPSGFVPDEDQGYAVIGVQLPDGASLQRTKAVYTKIDAILAQGPRASAPTTASPASASSRAPRRATPAPASSASSRGTSARRDDLTSSRDRCSAQHAVLRRIPEARVFAFAPPAIPGISAAGGFSMMLQDPAAATYAYLAAERRASSWPRRTKRPELADCARSSRRPCRSSSPTSTRRRRSSGRADRATSTRAAGVPGRLVRQRLQPLRPAVAACSCRPSRRTARRPTTSRSSTCATRRARWCRCRRSCTVRSDDGPRVHGALQPVSLGRDPWARTAPGYSSGQALAALEEVARRRCRPRWATRGTRSRTRRRRRRAARRASSGCRSCSCS